MPVKTAIKNRVHGPGTEYLFFVVYDVGGFVGVLFLDTAQGHGGKARGHFRFDGMGWIPGPGKEGEGKDYHGNY